MTPDEYATMSAAWDAAMTHYFPHREAQLKHLFEAVDAAAPTPQRILEIGSGLGTITAKAAEHWPSARITGVDLDPVAVHVGQSLGKPTVDLILGDVTQPGWEKAWEPGSFDVVFSVTSLHYLTADQLPQVAAGVAALLREGGVFANYDRMTHPRFVTPPSESDADSGDGETSDSADADTPESLAAWRNMWATLRESDAVPQELWDERDAIFGDHSDERNPPLSAFAAAWTDAGFAAWDVLAGPGDEQLFIAASDAQS